jgi:hypothetical protein
MGLVIDRDFAALKEWIARNSKNSDPSGQALLNFMNSLEIEASMDRSLAVLLRRVLAAAVDDAQRQQQAP